MVNTRIDLVYMPQITKLRWNQQSVIKSEEKRAQWGWISNLIQGREESSEVFGNLPLTDDWVVIQLHQRRRGEKIER